VTALLKQSHADTFRVSCNSLDLVSQITLLSMRELSSYIEIVQSGYTHYARHRLLA